MSKDRLTRLEWKVLTAIRKAHKPITGAAIAIVLDRRRETIDAAAVALVAGGFILAARGGFTLASPPETTSATQRFFPKPGYADGYGWRDD